MSEEIIEIAEQIRHEVESVIGIKVGLNTQMISQKLLDSIKVVDLALALEERFGIVIETAEIRLESFESCEALARFVLEKRR